MNKQLREDFARDGAALARELMGSQRVAASTGCSFNKLSKRVSH